jgi:acetolactate synthase-1/2/3 large subunit
LYTASTAFLEALTEAGISKIFANLGSDHPGIIEALAAGRVEGRRVPDLVTCPNEMVALSAAHGCAMTTGQPQCVLVHVECGTQALGGAVHNAAKGRVPVLIVAGASPYTQEGELRGSRNEFIQWLQDVHDQRGIVRQYMRYDAEIRSGRNLKQMVSRALQFATSEPRGPVYLMIAREVLEEEVPPVSLDRAEWPAVAPGGLAPESIEEITAVLLGAHRPLVVTSYLGRRPAAVTELVKLCRRLGMGVLDSVPHTVNFPADEPLYQGCWWNEPAQNQALGEADVVLVIDSDVPWVPTVTRPRPDATVLHIDSDPLKEAMPLWYIRARGVYRADSFTSLRQINARLDRAAVDNHAVADRIAQSAERRRDRVEALYSREVPEGDTITVPYLVSRLRGRLDADCVVLNESITNYGTVVSHLMSTRPASMFTSGGGSLGWNGGAAIGAKLAQPDKTVVAIGGDGSYMFSIPSTVHWMARQYRAPFLQIVLNNRGWRAPKFSMLAVHPKGYASGANEIGVTFDPPPDYAGIAAAAGGALGLKVERADELEAALEAGFRAVREEGRAAVLDVWLAHL